MKVGVRRLATRCVCRQLTKHGDAYGVLLTPPRAIAIPERVTVVPRASRPGSIDELVVQRLLDIVDDLGVSVRDLELSHARRSVLYESAMRVADRARDVSFQSGDKLA
jgi:hypothetical protein